MIYYNNGTKRDLLIENLRAYHVRNHFFGTQTVEISEITCQDAKPITFFNLKKFYLESLKSRFKRSRSDLSAKLVEFTKLKSLLERLKRDFNDCKSIFSGLKKVIGF